MSDLTGKGTWGSYFSSDQSNQTYTLSSTDLRTPESAHRVSFAPDGQDTSSVFNHLIAGRGPEEIMSSLSQAFDLGNPDFWISEGHGQYCSDTASCSGPVVVVLLSNTSELLSGCVSCPDDGLVQQVRCSSLEDISNGDILPWPSAWPAQ
jgi:hypothetical protein